MAWVERRRGVASESPKGSTRGKGSENFLDRKSNCIISLSLLISIKGQKAQALAPLPTHPNRLSPVASLTVPSNSQHCLASYRSRPYLLSQKDIEGSPSSTPEP